MGEARLHVVFGTGQAGSSLRNWPGWVSRSGRCPGTGQSRWLGGPTGGPRVPPIARWPPARPRTPRWCTSAFNAPYAQWPERFPLLQRACWLLPSAPALLVVENLRGTAGPGESRPAQGEGERSWVLLTRR